MGYHTEFRGALKFNSKLTGSQMASIRQIIGEDCRNHPEWGVSHLAYIDLQLLDDNSGLTWDGSECTYHMPELVNVVISQIRKQYPDFGLSGSITAQGSAVGDIWELYIGEDGLARKRGLVISRECITCPNCAEIISL